MKADDLDGVSDPSKLPASYFAYNAKYTPAGWTTSSMTPALKSEVSLGKTTFSILGRNNYTDLSIKASINKDDIKVGKNILLGSIQQVVNKSQPSEHLLNYRSDIYSGGNREVDFQGQKIGEIETATQHPVNARVAPEFDIFLHVTNTISFANNPQIEYHSPKGGFQFGYTPDWYDWTPWKGLSFPVTYSLITPNNIYNYTFNDTHDIDRKEYIPYSSIYNDTQNNAFGLIVPISNNTIKVHHIIKFQPSINNIFNKYADYNDKSISATVFTHLVNERGNYIDEDIAFNGTYEDPINIIRQKKNITATDLYKSTPANTIIFNLCPDGSLLISYNINNKIKVSSKSMKDAVNDSYYTNVQAPDQATEVLNQNLQKSSSLSGQIHMIGSFGYTTQDKNFAIMGTDLTPVSNKFTNDLETHIIGGQSFNAELYRTALVHYLDSKTDNNISNDSIIGTKNNSTNYTLNIPKGYILDTKSGKNKDGTQYKWSADKKSIAYTFNEDQKVNDANPINIYITHGTHNTNDNSGKSTRTIQYTGLPDNLKPKDNVQTVLFKRSGVTDDVTGETTYGDWQPQSGNGHYTAVTSPTFAGYKPDQTVVPDTAATAGKDETVTVNYSRTDQNAKLTVHDDTANTDLNDYTENSIGLYQDQINFKTAPSAVEQELKDKGYNIVSDSFKGSPTYNADDSKNNFVIHVTHKIVPVTPDQPKTPTDVIPDTKQHYPTGVGTNDLNKDVQRSIFYKYEDNTQAEPTVVQKAHFDRTVKVDAVTQKIVDDGTWATKDNYPEVATKSIDGYTPDKTKVDSATPSMTTNQDQTVVYHANDEDAAITYIDDTTGKVLKTDTQKAKYKQAIKFATDPNTQIQTYKDQGYVLVSSDWKNGSTYQTDPTKNKFTVHLKHGTSTVTPDKPKKPTDIIPGTNQHYPTGVDTNDLNQPQQRQIIYTYADSKKQASPTITQKATFHRTATVDNVTGKTTYTDWTTSDQYPEVKSPAIEGYTPDKSNVPVTKPVLNTKQDVAVTYHPNPEQVDVIAQDNTGKQLSKSTLHGNYNTDYSATTPVIKGYHLIKMPANTHGTYKTHNDPIIYIYAPDSNSVPEQTDGTPKPDKSLYPDDITPAKRSTKLPETGSINLVSDINSVTNSITHVLQHLLH